MLHTRCLFPRGFTLIELLVVFSIIGLLSSTVLVSLNLYRNKAYNTKRIAQVDQLRVAFNVAATSGVYPNVAQIFPCISVACYGGLSSYVSNATVDAFFATTITKPVDPSGGRRGSGGFFLVTPASMLAGWAANGTPVNPLWLDYFIGFVLEWPVAQDCGMGIPDTHQYHNGFPRTDAQFFAGNGANLWCYLRLEQ